MTCRTLFSILFCVVVFNGIGQVEADLRKEVRTKSDTAKITAYLNLAKFYYSTTGKGDSLFSLGTKARDLARAKKSPTHEIDANTYIGVSFFVDRNYPKAELYYKLAAEQASKGNDYKRLIGINNKLGALYGNWEKPEKAIPHLIKAAKSAEKIKDYDQECYAYYGISNMYINLDDGEKRIEYIEKALELMVKHPIRDDFRVMVYSLASQHYLELHEPKNNYLKKAERYANMGLTLSKKNNWTHTMPSLLNSVGAVAYLKNDFKESKRLAHEALLNSEQLREDTKFSIYVRLAALARRENSAGEAFNYLSLLENSPMIVDDYYSLKYWEEAKQIYKTFGRLELALNALEKVDSIKMKMHKSDNEKLIFELETKYKSELKDAQIGKLNQQQKIDALEIDRSRANLRWIIGAAIILILIAVIVIFVMRQRAVMERLKTLESEQRLNRARMDPHFFFNALGSIQTMALKEESPKTALVLAKFTKVMRQSLESTYVEMNTIEDEVSFLTQYLELQKLRHPSKFDFVFDISEELEIDEVQLPSMLLQPFIENSIEHGFKNMETGGLITISMCQLEDHLEIRLMDNGNEVAEASVHKAHKSRATEIITDRLFLLKKQTGKQAFFKVDVNSKEYGYQISVTLPLIYKTI